MNLKSVKKFKTTVALASTIAVLIQQTAQAAGPATLPSGGRFVAGAGSIAASGNALTVNQASLRGIVDWSSFSIGKGGLVTFRNGSGATLNRVTGSQMSTILGSLVSSGSVYLINPQGILIGPRARVKTGGDFAASTLDISNSSFLTGGSLVFQGNSPNTVVNLGSLYSQEGSIFLLGRSVTNSGVIHAPQGTAGLAAGTEILVKDSTTDQRISVQAAGGDLTNTGRISGAQAELKARGGNIYALAGNNGGQISANGTATINGDAWIVSTGGATNVSGSVYARHSVETSGERLNVDGASVKTGKGGAWLLDPVDLTIDSSAATSIQNSLATTNVTVSTSASSSSGFGTTASGSGDINVNSNVAWSSGNSLKLSAYRNISIANGVTISNTGAGNLTLYADNAATGTGTVNFNTSGKVDFHGGSGNVSLYYHPAAYPTATSFTTGSSGQVYMGSGAFTPYMTVDTVSDLQNINSNDTTLAGTYALNTDLDAAALDNFTPIGLYFTGVFDGQGHEIRNLTITDSDGYESYLGLFQLIQPGAVVKNLTLTNLTVSSPSEDAFFVNMGGLAGYAQGTISKVSVSGSVTAAAGGSVGGLVGVNNGSIDQSSSSATVNSGSGGANTGGLVGRNNSTRSITNSYATGSVANDGNGFVGGFVGRNSGTIATSYSTGAVSARGGQTGGFAAASSGSITSAYFNTTTSGTATDHGGAGVTAMATSQLQTASLPSGFSSTYWSASYGNYPQLQWKLPSGITVSGAVYSGSGTVTVYGLAGGASFGSTTASANGGTYSLTAPANSSGVLVYLSTNGSTFSDGGGSSTFTGIDIYTGQVRLLNSSNSTYTGLLTALTSALGSNNAGNFSLSGNTLTLSSANLLISNTASSFNINAALNASTNNVIVNSSTAVTQSAALTAAGLALLGAGSFTLSNAGNSVATLAANTTGNLTVSSSGALGIGAVAGTNGVASSGTVVLGAGSMTQTQPLSAASLALSGSGNFTLTHASNSFGSVAANVSGNRIYGAADPGLSGTVTGFVAGENLNSATTGAPTFSSSATQWSDVGQYGILGSGLSANQGNYTFTQAPGNNSAFRITPAPVTATVLASDKVYDGATNAAGSLQLRGVLNDDNVLATGATYQFSDKNAGTGKTVSEAGGALSGTKAVDYVLTSVTPGAASITPAPLTATYTANNKMYDATSAAAGTLGALSGVLGQDNVALAGIASYTFADPNAGVGKAVCASGLRLTGADAPNYTLTLVQDGSTAISPAPLLYVASPGNARPYGSPNPSVSGVVTGLQGSDTLTSTTTGALAFSSPAVPSSNVGSYAVKGSGLSLTTGNYTLSQAPDNTNVLSVTPIVISIGSVTRAASQPNLTFRASYSGLASDYVQSVLSNLALVTNAPIGNNPGTYQITAVVPPEIANDLIIQPGFLTITNDALPASMQTQSAQMQAASLPAPVATGPSTSAAIAPANATGAFQIVIAPSQNWVSPAAPSATNSGAALSVASFTEPEPAANGSNTDRRNTYAAGARK